jgi:transmembrane sensor
LKVRTITKYLRLACFWKCPLSLPADLFLFVFFFSLAACSGLHNKTERPMLQLPDGSKVFKEDSTVVSLDSGFNRTNRILYFEGKVFFTIAQNTDLPFVVRTKSLEITVSDSAIAIFSVDANDSSDSGGEEVDLLRGVLKISKSFHSETDSLPVIIRSGEMVMINRGIDLMESEKFDTTTWKQQVNAND